MNEVPATPTQMARYLITYITDDSAIATHIKTHFGLPWTKDDIARMRSTAPRKYMKAQGKVSASDSVSEKAMTRENKPYTGPKDPLLKALASYHYKRSKTKEAQKHWWALM